ncbi:MAG: DNA/RNA nuclease SfsA [Anaerolineae bacterium]|nr:DNA/RNA nuclease SfsA [Anaerolineae bacterium]NIN97213.1 DNA/RNA nuclease SfsA [Anaerolineae bacterium]NIQ80166.1 DNA/RNA nuclease SfsA [Anaerolineae bacterium]
MKVGRRLLEGAFIARENRFRARVRLAGEERAAHVPNSGRLTELLSPDHPILLAEARSPHRVTDYDLLMVSLPHTLVSIDARLPNKLFHEAVENCALPEFLHYSVAQREVVYGDSRLDFLLEADGERGACLVEVKSVTLVQEGIGRFPDAVTERGARHLNELRRASLDGNRTAVVFVIQRADAEAFAPHDESDARFGEVLREVAFDGVEVYSYTCGVSRSEIVVRKRVPVLLGGDV